MLLPHIVKQVVETSKWRFESFPLVPTVIARAPAHVFLTKDRELSLVGHRQSLVCRYPALPSLKYISIYGWSGLLFCYQLSCRETGHTQILVARKPFHGKLFFSFRDSFSMWSHILRSFRYWLIKASPNSKCIQASLHKNIAWASEPSRAPSSFSSTRGKPKAM